MLIPLLSKRWGASLMIASSTRGHGTDGRLASGSRDRTNEVHFWIRADGQPSIPLSALNAPNKATPSGPAPSFADLDYAG
jgi:hypothetical protein